MSTLPAVLVTMALFTAAGLLPAWRLVGWRPVTLFLSPLAGMLMAGIAGAFTVLVAGGVLRWFVAIVVSVNAAALASWLAHREDGEEAQGLAGHHERGTADHFSSAWSLTGLVCVLGSVGWCLRSVVRPRIGFDARSIWLEHATWIYLGHATAHAALMNAALPFAHQSYPPLGGAVVAIGWSVSHTQSYRVGQVILATATAVAVGAAGCVLVELGTATGRRLRVHGGGLLPASLVATAGVIAAVAWCFGVYGLAGGSATNGYVDLLWSASAVGAAGFGLAMPLGSSSLRVAAVLMATGGLTKNEGAAAGAALVVLLVLRWWKHRPDVGPGDDLGALPPAAGLPPQGMGSSVTARLASIVAGHSRQVAWGIFGLASVIAWPLTMILVGAQPDPDLSGRRHGSIASRLDATVRSLADHLHPAGLALAVGVFGLLLMGTLRRRLGIGADPWIWAMGAAEVLATAAFYVIGTTVIDFWLATSVDRVTIFANSLGLAAIGYWSVVAAAAALGPRSLVSPAGAPASRRGLPGADPPVGPRGAAGSDGGLSGAPSGVQSGGVLHQSP